MARHTDRSILLVLSAEQSSQLRRLVGATATASRSRSGAPCSASGSGLLLALLVLGWLGREVASTLIQWAAKVAGL